jgi:hypothetical protein
MTTLGASHVRNDKIGPRRKRCVDEIDVLFCDERRWAERHRAKLDPGIARFLAIPAPEVLEPIVLDAIITPEFSTARGEQST